MSAFKWTFVILCVLNAVLRIRDAGRHGQPQEPYHAGVQALAAALNIAMAAWALAVLR